VVNVPVSIDTLNPDEIREAVASGADLILSVDEGNIEQVAAFATEIATVVIPTNQRKGYFPVKAEERVHFLEEINAKARNLGMKKLIADLILEPSNVLESMIAFRDFQARNPDVPLFVGISNVTELMDADSVGINALLARLSAEVNASMLLATEKSDKAQGTVREEAIASKMMFLAKRRGSVPKDLGFDLLILKNKRKHEEAYDKAFEANARVILGNEEATPAILDPQGVFRIMLDRNAETIVALHFATTESDKPSNIIKGETAEAVYAKILEMKLVTRLDHAAYLGSELAKAETALKTGKEYIQDKPLFMK
jgi:dihydropteroate synthase-like protein